MRLERAEGCILQGIVDHIKTEEQRTNVAWTKTLSGHFIGNSAEGWCQSGKDRSKETNQKVILSLQTRNDGGLD